MAKQPKLLAELEGKEKRLGGALVTFDGCASIIKGVIHHTEIVACEIEFFEHLRRGTQRECDGSQIFVKENR